jgi:hypothetical protein
MNFVEMIDSRNKIWLTFFIIVMIGSLKVYSQDLKIKEAQKVFSRIEDGISTGSVDKFSNYFHSRNYLSLKDDATGYFSFNQAYYVIKDFLSVHQPIGFKLTNIVTDTSSPFAAGNLRYYHKGVRGNATLFISLQWMDNQWRISQITIN